MATTEYTTEELATEEWREVPEYESYYQVSNLGRVRRIKACQGTRINRLLKPQRSEHYWIVILYDSERGRTQYLHKIVMTAFVGPRPEGYEINHKDGNKLNPRLDNLEYLTPADNMKHAASMGLIPSGDRHWSRLHPEKIARGDRNGARKHPERIPRGVNSWPHKHRDKIARGENQGHAKLTEAKVREIRAERANEQTSYAKLGRKYGVSPVTIYHIVKRNLWCHVE
jgi:hypothetical protein